MTADELHTLAVRTRDAARLAERHGTSTHGYRRAAREACERMGEMAEQLAEAEERAREADLDAQALGEDCRSCADLEHQLAEMTRDRDRRGRQLVARLVARDRDRRGRQLVAAEGARDEARDVVNRCANVLHRLVPEMASRGGPCLPDEVSHALASAVHFRDEARAERDAAREVARCESSLRLRWEERTEEARDELRSLLAAVTSLNDDDGPRAKAIQHARAVLEEWGMR